MDEENIVLEPENKEVIATVIWMHGLGADANDFMGIDKALQRTAERGGVRYILPNAPTRPVTINGGMSMRAWYDIVHFDRLQEVDEAGIKQSKGIIHDLIENEMAKGIPSSNIFLAGFSQGGAIALYVGTTYEKTLGGVIALSTYYPNLDKFASIRTKESENTPIFYGHGTHDDVIPHKAAELSRQTLKEAGYEVECKDYGTHHSITDDEIRDIDTWLCEKISK